MHSHNNDGLVPSPAPNGYDSQLLEALENPFRIEASEEDDALNGLVRVDAAHVALRRPYRRFA
jgi:hypothetical protein